MVHENPVSVRPWWALALAPLLVTACDPADSTERAGPSAPPAAAPPLEPMEAPWSSEALREVVRLQVERDEEALLERLEAEDPAVRARAAFALGSFRESEAGGELEGLLEDPEPEVRRAAAFSLRFVTPPGAPSSLLDALEAEDDTEVRARLLEALARHGTPETAEWLVEWEVADLHEEYHRTNAVARISWQEPPAESLKDFLLQRLEHDDRQVRKAASLFFPGPDPEAAWGDRIEEVRTILDRYPMDEPAAMNLVLGLGILQDPEDADRFVRWMEEAEDWRIRVNAARALGTNPLLVTEGTREALWRQVEEGPEHVAMAAAHAYMGGFMRPRAVRERMWQWVREGPVDRWRTQGIFLRELAGEDAEEVLRWAERAADQHPEVITSALRSVGTVPAPRVTEFTRELPTHDDPAVRGYAAYALGNQAMMMGEQTDEDFLEETFAFLEELVLDGSALEVALAGRAMPFPAFGQVDSPERIVAAAEGRADRDPPASVLVTLLRTVGEVSPEEEGLAFAERYVDHPDFRVRTAARWAVGLIRDEPGYSRQPPQADPELDWEALEALGPEPRLHLEMDHGEVAIRLLPSEAPLTVQMVARLAQEGSYDGVPFHRVVSNAMAQSGDYVSGDGAGDPGFELRTERTRLPFHRGMVGMASRGPDTEDSQFFITHSWQPNYEGEHTPFGWVEAGSDVVDRILPGDRIRRAWVENGNGVD